MLWACNLFVMSAGLIVSSAIIDMNKFYRLSGKKIKNSGSAMCFSSHFLSVLGAVYICFVVPLITSPVFYFSVFFVFIFTWILLACFLYVPTYNLSLPYHNCIGAGLTIHYVFGGKSICYLSCWLVIGIRINPSWGLTVALFIISIAAAFTYAVYLYLEVYNLPKRL